MLWGDHLCLLAPSFEARTGLGRSLLRNLRITFAGDAFAARPERSTCVALTLVALRVWAIHPFFFRHRNHPFDGSRSSGTHDPPRTSNLERGNHTKTQVLGPTQLTPERSKLFR